MRKQAFIAVFGGLVFIAGISPTFAQQSSQKGASVSFSFKGMGDGSFEVRGADGKIQEVLKPSDVQLNQPPPHVVARERAYRKKRQEEAKATRERKAEKRRVAEDEAALAETSVEEQSIAAEENAARIAAEQTEKPLNPYRNRRKTIRRKIVQPETADN